MTRQDYKAICEDIGLRYDCVVYDNRDKTASDDVLKFKFELVRRLKGNIGDYKLKLNRALRPCLYIGRDYPKLGEILIINFNQDCVEIETSLERLKFGYEIEIIYNKVIGLIQRM